MLNKQAAYPCAPDVTMHFYGLLIFQTLLQTIH